MKAVKFYISAIFFITIILYSCSSDYTKSLGDNYFYRFEGGELNDIYNKKANGGEIPATVIAYDFDNNFIIAKQKPKLPQDILYNKEYKYDKGDKEFYYWLIIKENHTVYGPLSNLEFEKIKSKYNVSEKLVLE